MYSVRSAMGVWVAKNACVATLMPEPNPVTIRPAMSQSIPTVGLQSATMAGAVAYITPPIACAYTDGGQHRHRAKAAAGVAGCWGRTPQRKPSLKSCSKGVLSVTVP